MKALEEMLAEKRSHLTKVQVEIATLEDLLRRASGHPEPVAPTIHHRRGVNVKQVLLDMLSERSEQGLNAATAVDLARKKGEHLERGTASSLLSRLKSEGVLNYDGAVYRLQNKSASGPVLAYPPSKTASL